VAERGAQARERQRIPKPTQYIATVAAATATYTITAVGCSCNAPPWACPWRHPPTDTSNAADCRGKSAIPPRRRQARGGADAGGSPPRGAQVIPHIGRERFDREERRGLRVLGADGLAESQDSAATRAVYVSDPP
jgi:hypothetical protein